ncbi:MAG: autotransporter outer membrane beta-barrel domain-containing protein [Niveispirillum sp.]|nr:autotransporter outer membrane beta-barrel domain-containing protein [Niveispirillum sp.]
MGRIVNRSSDLRFLSGDTRLNSAIDVGTHNVVNAGATLRIDSTVSITGNFTQTAGALVFGVGSPTAYGSLVVSGTSGLSGGTVTLTPITGTPFMSGQTYTIVQSGGAISLGNINFTSGGFNITPSIVSAGGVNDLVVQLQSNFTEVGVVTGGAAVGTGAALDQIAAITTGTPAAVAVQTEVLTPLAQLSPSQQEEAITQLSPSQLTPQLSVVLPTPASAAVGQRQLVTSNALASGERGLAAGGAGEKGAVWGQILGNNVWRGTSGNASGYKGDTFGLITGVDWFATEELAVGAAFSWMRSDTDGRGPMTGSSTKINSYQFTTYATWRPESADSRLSVGAQLGAGHNDFNQNRYIQFLQRQARADYGGKQYLGKIDIGYDLIKWDEQVITPKWSLRSVRLVNESYTETGAGAADMRVLGVRADALTQELGVQAKTGFNSVLGPTKLDLEMAWVHDYLQGPIATTGVLGGVAFTSTSERPAADGLAIRFGATVAHSDAVDFRLEYGGELRRKFLSNTIMTRATIRF